MRALQAFKVTWIVTLLVAVCSSRAQDTPATDAALPTKLDCAHLPNPVRIHARVISGGLPEGDAGFAELAALGVKTLVSVDGAQPDVEAAKRHGLRYVHLPHGYNGIAEPRIKELAKAVHDLESPIYIHCHHGKHRSPAAAAVACVSAGLIQPEEAMSILTLAGTSANYRGLYQSVEHARPLKPELLDELEVNFQETAHIPPMAEAMVALQHASDHIKELSNANWKARGDDPDEDPAHAVLLLRELFTELIRSEDVRQKPAKFRALLDDSQATTHELELAVRGWIANRNVGSPPEKIGKLTERILSNCTECHQSFRDTRRQESH